MKSFVFTFRVQPPHMETFMARSGGSVFDAAYSRTLDQFYLVAGGSLEKIGEPEMIYVTREYARQHPRTFSKHPPRSDVNQFRAGRKKRPVQLSLALS